MRVIQSRLVVRGVAAARISISRALRRVQLMIKRAQDRCHLLLRSKIGNDFFFGNDFFGGTVKQWNGENDRPMIENDDR
jgi:hypothetical protein